MLFAQTHWLVHCLQSSVVNNQCPNHSITGPR